MIHGNDKVLVTIGNWSGMFTAQGVLSEARQHYGYITPENLVRYGLSRKDANRVYNLHATWNGLPLVAE